MDFIVKDSDDVTDRDDSHELRACRDGNLGDPALAHLSHDLFDIIIEVAGHGIASHDIPHPEPAETLSLVMNESQDVALAEDPDQALVVIQNRKGANVVLYQLGDGFADGRFVIDRENATTFGFKDISNQHEALLVSQRASVGDDVTLHRLTLLAS
jgi:hypothetical protein